MGIINAALIKASEHRDLATHFIIATEYYTDFDDQSIDFLKPIKHAMLEGMKKYRLKTAVLTRVNMQRERLVTKEKMTDYYKGKYIRINGPYVSHFEHSLNDDLEILLKKMQLGQVTNEEVLTFCLPKLTEKEMKLVELKDEDHMASYAAYWDIKDVDEAEMKLSDSKSKFVDILCFRKTFVLQNRPINGYFKRSIDQQAEDEPRPKNRRKPCDSCKKVYAYPSPDYQ